MHWVPGRLSSWLLEHRPGVSQGWGTCTPEEAQVLQAQRTLCAAPPSLSQRRIPGRRGGGRAGVGVRAWDPSCGAGTPQAHPWQLGSLLNTG